MFDLPVTTPKGRREYTMFRKFLIKDGFMMLQESIYCRLAQNQYAANALINHIKANSPSSGLVQILCVTEKQYSNMVMVVGEKKGNIISSSKRLVVL